MSIEAPAAPVSTQAPPAGSPAGAPGSSGSPPAGGAPGADESNAPWMEDINSGIDELDTQAPPPEGDKDKGGKPAGDKPPQGEKGAKPAAAAAAPPADDKTPSNIKDLRNGYETQKKKIREEYEPRIASLQKELDEIKKAPQFTQSKEQQDRVKAIEARNKELEAEIRNVNFTKSQEYLEKYHKPYVAAWEKARRDLAEVEVNLAGGGTRKATDADLILLAELPLGAARRKAVEMFGDAADDIMFHVRRITELSEQQEAAVKAAMQEVETRSKQETEKGTEAAQARVRLWNTTNQELATKYPAVFAPVAGDTEGNARLDKGFALADLLFAPRSLDAKKLELLPKTFREDIAANNGRLSEQGTVRLHALIRNKTANHDRAVAKANALTKRVAELEKALKEYEDSAPGGRPGTPGARGGAGTYLDDPNAEIDKLNNPNI